MTLSNRQIISVSELNRDVRRLLESGFPMLYIEGEISNLAQPGSGHWYFTLKDEKSQVRCAMFRNRNMLVRFKPRNGQQVVVRGRVSLYEGRGEFQLIAEFIEDSGDGALRRAFENLKARLQEEGLFDESRKRPIPTAPAHIAIITSPAGAAIRDVITVMQRRFPAVRLSILPVQVQGEESVAQIVRALAFANEYGGDIFDLILLTRGGGSLEDLWSFNTEPVARAVSASQLPVVCAVGHETDVSIADFVADLRAPTPSAAAELITPDGASWLEDFRYTERRLLQLVSQRLADQQRELTHLGRRLRHPSRYLSELSQRLDDIERRLHASGRRLMEGRDVSSLAGRLKSAMISRLDRQRARIDRQHLNSPVALIRAGKSRVNWLSSSLQKAEAVYRQNQSNRLRELVSRLNTLSPLATLERGYAIVTAGPDDHVITNSGQVVPGDNIRVRLMDGELSAEVKGEDQ